MTDPRACVLCDGPATASVGVRLAAANVMGTHLAVCRCCYLTARRLAGPPGRSWPARGAAITLRYLTDAGDLAGAYDPDTGVLWLAVDLTPGEMRTTLAHELLHALRGDALTGDPDVDDATETLVEALACELVGRRRAPTRDGVDAA